MRVPQARCMVPFVTVVAVTFHSVSGSYCDVLDVLTKRPNGVRMHIADVFIDEVERACPLVSCR